MALFKKRVKVGQFAKKGIDYKDGDRLTILNEGTETEGTFGPQTVFLMKMPDGSERTLGFNQTSINNMVDAYGHDSKNWVGKQVRVWLILQNVQGKMVKVTYVSHPNADIDDDGNFEIPQLTSDASQMPTGLGPDEEVNIS